MINIPNCLTVIRILLTPFIAKALIMSDGILAALLLLVAGITDTLDGMLARYLNQQTVVGRILDPLADKLLLLICYSTLMWHPYNTYITASFFGLALVRECCILIGTTVLCYLHNNLHVAQPTIWGKLAMLGQILFLMMNCLYFSYGHIPLFNTISALLLVSASILMTISWIHYLSQGILLWRS